MFSNWVFIVILYLIFAVIFAQSYKRITNNMISAGALTVLAEVFAGLAALLFIPLFGMKFPSNIYVYVFLALASIFYALNDRLSTTVRKGLEASTFSMIKQSKTVFMILAGLIFFKDPFVLTKVIGAFLIVFSNILVFYKKGGLKSNKYVWIGVLAAIFQTIAALIDVNYSKEFNLPIYVAFTTIVPALLIFIFDRVNIKDIVKEYKNCNKTLLYTVGLSWGIMVILNL
jgi:drug/metabolite transporter (DMT)-like permease